MNAVLAVNIGATKRRSALFELFGGLVSRTEAPTLADDYRGTLAAIHADAQQQLDAADAELVAAAVCVAAPSENGAIDKTANLPDWAGRNLLLDLEALFGVPVVLRNDAEMEALGEYHAHGFPITYGGLGTGTGFAFVFEHGDHVICRATELGHTVIDRNSTVRCGCGGFGHLEAFVGGANLPRRFGFANPNHPTDQDWAGVTDQQWSEVLDDLAVGLASIALANKGAPIVLGGGNTARWLAPTGKNLLAVLQGKVDQQTTTLASPQLLLASHGEDSALYGLAQAASEAHSAQRTF